ncbi:MAG: hypothetical protein AAF633_16155 [Chloroflexota bacterium]
MRWFDPANKLFPYQVGFTAPPHDFDGGPSNFLRISPQTVGVHGRMLHVPATPTSSSSGPIILIF